MEMMETGLYYKTSSHLFVQHTHHPEDNTPCLYTFAYLPFFVFALINYSMFSYRIRQVFLELSGQTKIICMSYSVHNHPCVIKFFTRQFHSRQ